jgi:hypothetical protein
MTVIYEEHFLPVQTEEERVERRIPSLMPQPGDKCCRCGEAIYGMDAIQFDVYGRMPDLNMHPACAEEIVTVVVQDLARLIDHRGFVIGTYMSSRHENVVPSFEKVLLAGRAQTLPDHGTA